MMRNDYHQPDLDGSEPDDDALYCERCGEVVEEDAAVVVDGYLADGGFNVCPACAAALGVTPYVAAELRREECPACDYPDNVFSYRRNSETGRCYADDNREVFRCPHCGFDLTPHLGAYVEVYDPEGDKDEPVRSSDAEDRYNRGD